MIKVYRDVNQADFVANISDAMDTYQRQSNGVQGDVSATLRLIRSKQILTDYLKHWLGYWIVEHLPGEPENPTFLGQIYTLRLFSEGRVYLTTLDDVINDVVLTYDVPAGGGPFTATATNNSSVSRYGLQASLQSSNINIDAPTAAAYVADIVADFAQPEAQLVGFYDPKQGNYLEMTVRGIGRFLERELFERTGGGGLTDNVSNLILEAVAASSVIVAGNISNNSNRQAELDTAYTTIWARLNALLGLSGTAWRLNVLAGKKLDYYEISKTQPRYRLTFSEGRNLFWSEEGHLVPDQAVRPGHYVRVPEIPGLPDTLLLDSLSLTGLTGLQFTPAFQDRLSLIRSKILGGA